LAAFSSGTDGVVGLVGFSESANIKTAGKNTVLKHGRKIRKHTLLHPPI
jgi:hypothetical protein